MSRLFGRGICFLIGLMLVSSAYSRPSFPVPRAESEFRSLLDALVPRAQKLNGHANQFVQQAMPLGLFDLHTTKASAAEAETLRNYYLGVMGAAARVDAAELANSFHCGPPCAASRLKHLTGLLSAIEVAVNAFRKANRLTAVALNQSGHRLDDYFFLDNQYSKAIASPIMGFVPSGKWEPTEDAQVLEKLGLTVTSRDKLLGLMRSADLVSLATIGNGSVRAIWAGIGDNEAGLLFLGKTTAKPAIGSVISGAGTIVALERIRENVYFYTTT